jgi:AraC-like DNA-binding protein
MFADGERLWIGTETGGLNKITPLRLQISNYVHDPNRTDALSPNPVNAIYEDASERLWAGTVEGGLNRLVGTDNFVHYTTKPPARLSHNSISVITTDHSERLWLGTWGNGVTLLDLHSPDFRTLQTFTSQTVTGFPDFIGFLQFDPVNQGMWIGSNSGIFFYDLQTGRLHHPFEPDVNGHVRGCIGSVIDRQDRLWAGTMEGVFRFDLRSRGADNRFSYVHYRHKLDNPESVRPEGIACFCIANDGTLWIGSNGYGIYKYMPPVTGKPEQFVNYNNERGLINNNVRGMLEDEQGRLWISTINGLSCFDPKTESFINYTTEDGLPGNQFYWNAYCKARDGRLFFGGLAGMACIETDLQNNILRPATVKLTRLLIAEKEIYSDSRHIDFDISMAKKLTLHESDKSFALEFSSLTYESKPVSGFSYRLPGFDEKWIDVPPTRRYAAYTNLPANTYTFQVRYNMEGVNPAENPVTELTVVIRPYFYKTWWFICLLATVIICSMIYLYFSRIAKLKKQKELLNLMVEERTKELKAQHVHLVEMTKQVEELKEKVENSNDRKFLDKATAIMKEHYTDPDYEQAEFLTTLGISKSAANKRFRTLTGLSVGEYIRHYRLNTAYDLIKENRLSKQMNISDIAYAVGFNDPKYFSRCFVKRYEITPTQLLMS